MVRESGFSIRDTDSDAPFSQRSSQQAETIDSEDNRYCSTGAGMPDAGTDMGTDSGRMFGVKVPSTADEENTSPSLSSGLQADILRNFYHTKRVGNYLIGRKLGEGSFAKVREGLHAITGEKVRRSGVPRFDALLAY